MTKDILTFREKTEARTFYLAALSLGVWVDWQGVDVGDSGELYWKIVVNKEKTMELIYKEG